MTSFLGEGAYSEEEREKIRASIEQEKHRRELDPVLSQRAMRIARGYLRDYKNGQVTHKKLIEELLPVLEKIPYNPDFSNRHRVLAWIIEEAEKITPIPRKRGHLGPAPSVRRYALCLVRLAIKLGRKRDEAFDEASFWLKDAGLRFATPGAVKSWFYPHKPRKNYSK